MIETPQVKEAQGMDRSAANGHRLDPDEIAKVSPNRCHCLTFEDRFIDSLSSRMYT